MGVEEFIEVCNWGERDRVRLRGRKKSENKSLTKTDIQNIQKRNKLALVFDFISVI